MNAINKSRANAAKNTSAVKVKKPLLKRWWFWLIVGILFVGVILSVILVSLNLSQHTRAVMLHPDFTFSSNLAVRNCQDEELLSGYPDAVGRAEYCEEYIENLSNNNKINSGGNVALKPMLYLYPQQTMNVRVVMKFPNRITVDYPEYGKDGWDVLAQTNGTLTDSKGINYYGLYWDETQAKQVNFAEGFYVTAGDAVTFLEEKLKQIGLNDRERNEFIVFWLPILERNGKSLIYFELTDELQADNTLTVSPKPDSLLRVRMHVKKVNAQVAVAEQTLPHFDRKGFVVVEWGGVDQ